MTQLHYHHQYERLMHHKWPILTAAFGLLACLTLLLGLKTWTSDWQLAKTLGTAKANASLTATPHWADVIPNAHLFGKSPDPAGRIPLSSLNIKLSGISLDQDDEKRSNAMITTDDNETHVYYIGDTIMDNISLYQVLPDAVILNNAGDYEKLPLPRSDLQFSAPIPSEDTDDRP